MKKLLNTLYITTDDAYLTLDGGNVRILADHRPLGEVPLINLEGIVCMSRAGASPALLQACMGQNILLSFVSPEGRWQGQLTGQTNGNVLLRRTQYHVAENAHQRLAIARNFILGKVYNQRWVLKRVIRDHALAVDVPRLTTASNALAQRLKTIEAVQTIDSLRGEEGNAASEYYAVFGQMILQNKQVFPFVGRNRRPPLDTTNALLSFAYTLLAHECAAALLTVGLDPYVGFMHTARPGRQSLALDLMEELRGVYADRFVLKIINKRLLSARDFEQREDGAVMLKDAGRKTFIEQWQLRKKEKLTHPFLAEKIDWGLVPYAQALLLARHLRGDLDAYPTFLWK